MKYKYSLIVSQYYHSRHIFLVKIDENFIESARNFVSELEKYKRGSEDLREIYLGDLDEKYCGDELRSRYNINDAGDIYFINGNYANHLMYEGYHYYECTRRESVGYKRKTVTEDIAKHHNYSKVEEIVEKYFKIV